jgi:TATA-binding protein-associated factor Taf7
MWDSHQPLEKQLDTHLEKQLQAHAVTIDMSDKTNTAPNQSAVKNSEVTADQTHEWISTFNTSILTTRSNQSKDRSEELGELMQSPEFAALIVAAQHLAKTQNISKELATERVIDTFRKIDRAWKQIVMKRGLQSLIE